MSKLEGVGGGANLARPKSRHELGSRMSVLLSNPDYLLEGYVEKKCQYIGAIEDTPTSADMSDRGYLLCNLDKKRNTGKLPWTLDMKHNVSITISAYNMKIIQDDKKGNVLHRIPIHKIASASYINDDDHHHLFVMAGDADNVYCPCHVFTFSKRADAEETCTLLQQAFQLVYTEATMEHFNESISAGERGSRYSRSSLVLVPKPKSPQHQEISPSTVTASEHTTPVPTLMEETNSGEDTDAVELVQDYMERLHKVLDFKELREFATLLKHYREDLQVEDFLKKLKDLYGEQREFLIPDMNSFIPEEDKPAFEKFLFDHNIHSKSPMGNIPSQPPPPTGSHHQGQNSELENFLLELDQEMNSILTTNF